MAFEMFTGHVPFHDSDAPMAILLRHVNEEIPPVQHGRPVDRRRASRTGSSELLVKDPEKRTQSAVDAWDEFEEIVIGLLGPRWRRVGAAAARAEQVDTPKPLTPAPFEGTRRRSEPVSDEFQCFAWGQPITETPPGGAVTAAPARPGRPRRRRGRAARAARAGADRRADRPADTAAAAAGRGQRVPHVRRRRGASDRSGGGAAEAGGA